MQTCFFDSETLSLHSPAVIFQYAFDEEEPKLYNPWIEKVGDTRALIERMMQGRLVAHNLVFDHAKLQSFYAGILDFQDYERPLDDRDRFIASEYDNRSAFCLKTPKAVCTLLLCQKQLGGAALAAKEIRIRQIPVSRAEQFRLLLDSNTNLPTILFARKKQNRDDRWRVAESDHGPMWRDLVLSFSPSNGLKDIAELIFHEEIQHYNDIAPPEYPFDIGFCPYIQTYATSCWRYDGKPLWPELLDLHIDHWSKAAPLKYALDDVHLLRRLYKHLGSPDTDSDGMLACQVASVRMAGLGIDLAALEVARKESLDVVSRARINVDSPKQVKTFIAEALDPMEAHVVSKGCAKEVLNKIATDFELVEDEDCCDDEDCLVCSGLGYIGPQNRPVVERAKHVLEIRKHRKLLQLFDKLVISREAYPSFKIIGAKSGRMSGADGLNYHGIDKTKTARSIFTLSEPGWVVSGGDFDSQEICIMARVMNDSVLEEDVKKGRSLHAVFAEAAFNIPYDQIMARKSVSGSAEGVAYDKAKTCIYALAYGAAAFNISQTIGCSIEEADATILRFFEKYSAMGETRKKVRESLECLVSGEYLSVKNPERTYIDSVFGFRRSFSMEYSVINTLLETMDKLRSMPRDDSPKFIRKEKTGPQSASSMLISALYGACFSMQGKILRAALNHVIQSAGRTITMGVQSKIWELQPRGVYPFKLKLMSVHDELVVSSSLLTAVAVQDKVQESVEELCKTVPLLSLEWNINVGSWYGVKSAKGGKRMGFGS